MTVTPGRATFSSLCIGIMLTAGPGRPDAQPLPTFTDVSVPAGIRFRHVSGDPAKTYIFEAKGGGTCLLDYDADGWLDVYFVNGSTLRDVQRGLRREGALYRARGDGSYADVTREAGVPGPLWGMGCAVADYDNDGLVDLFVLGVNGNVLYRNAGGGRFVDATSHAGLGGGAWSTSAAFVDYDRDGDLDVYVANNIQVDVRRRPITLPGPDCNYRGTRVLCGPRGLPGAVDAFYRNNGDGTFTDVTAAAGVLEAEPRYGLGVVVGDYDNDGWPDVYVANDTTPSYLYRNRGDGTFEDVALLAGVAVSGDGLEQAGMGTDFGDYDNDGWLDLTKSNFAFEPTNLYHSERGRHFTERAGRSGIAVPTHPLVRWGTKFLDYDNDGWLDILVAAGHVYPHLISHPIAGETYEQPRLLFRNRGDGTFADVSASSGEGIRQRKSSRGLAVGDLDNDGDLDVVIANIDDAPSVLRNEGGSGGSWLSVRLRGRTSNRFGQGSRLRLRAGGLTMSREATTSGSIFSASDSRVHFGLGTATQGDLEVAWPSGKIQRIDGIRAGRIVEVDEQLGLTVP